MQVTHILHEPPTKQMGVKTNRTSLLPGNRSGHHNTKIKMSRYVIGQKEPSPFSTTFMNSAFFQNCILIDRLKLISFY